MTWPAVCTPSSEKWCQNTNCCRRTYLVRIRYSSGHFDYLSFVVNSTNFKKTLSVVFEMWTFTNCNHKTCCVVCAGSCENRYDCCPDLWSWPISLSVSVWNSHLYCWKVHSSDSRDWYQEGRLRWCDGQGTDSLAALHSSTHWLGLTPHGRLYYWVCTGCYLCLNVGDSE